jgi:uncharacterized repeat protein (TIGR03803 family)
MLLVDGLLPEVGVIMDAAGNLYGTTDYGGNPSDGGVAFALTPNASGAAWTETVLVRFSGGGTLCPNCSFPSAGLILDGSGNLYGTASGGGVDRNGVAFELVKSR